MRSYGQLCSIAKALDVVGDRWTLLIVRELLLQGPCRYTDLQRGLPGIATNLLGTRLRELEEAGLVVREEAPPPIATTLYRLTDGGMELEPVLRSLGRWGARFMPEGDDDEVFRGHWLAFPVSEFLADHQPGSPAVSVLVDVGQDSAVVEAGAGRVTVRPGTTDDPDLVLRGSPRPILGLLTGRLDPGSAEATGIEVAGDLTVLDRLLGSRSASAEPAGQAVPG